jgi:TPR repeat protein
LKWIRAAARQGDTYALALLAYDYQYSPGKVDRRRDRVLDYSLRGAQLGDADALGRTAMLVYEDGSWEVGEVLRMLEEAAGRGHLPSALLLGYHYWEGRRTARDGKLAVKWLKLAAQKGSHAAELVLAQCHASGFGVRKNEIRAEELFAAAAKVEPHFRNDFAWQLAVNPNEDVRDGARAVRIMEALLSHRENVSAARVDTLAAAYAEAGRFAEAAATQRRAISLLLRDPDLESQPGALARIRADFESRLALYVAGKPFRRKA